MPWLTAVFGAVISRLFAVLMGVFVWRTAQRIAMGTAFILASAGLFGTMALSVKAAILGARAMMPPALSLFTYFLPSDINLYIATMVTVRLIHFVWAWTQNNLRTFAGGSASGGYGGLS